MLIKAPSIFKEWIQLALKMHYLYKACYPFHPFSVFFSLFLPSFGVSPCILFLLMPTPHLQLPLSLESVRDSVSSPNPPFPGLKSPLSLVLAGRRVQLPPYFSNLIYILSFLNKNSFGKIDAGIQEKLVL